MCQPQSECFIYVAIQLIFIIASYEMLLYLIHGNWHKASEVTCRRYYN